MADEIKIPVANTAIGEPEAKAAYEAVKSGWVSSGPRVKEFEKEFCAATGAKHAVAVNNGTAALHTVLMALGIKEGDEVIIPSLTFISTANVVLFQNAKPVLAECDARTYNITAEEIEKRITPKTRAIIPVDMNGMPVDYDAVLEAAEKHNVPVIADSAESLGAEYKGKKIGANAPIHCFSFFPNKNITTGEGGMITLEDDGLAERVRIIMNQGQEGRYNHTVLGTNYRMTDIQAAVGIEQLKRLEGNVSAKQGLAERYDKAFAGRDDISVPFIPEYVTQHAWYMYAISIAEEKRDAIVKGLGEKGIQTRLSFPPIHAQPLYKEMFGFKEGDLPVTMKAWNRLIDIPLWAELGEEKQDVVIEALLELLE